MQSAKGFLILSNAGDVVFSASLDATPQLVEALKRAWQGDMRDGRLFTIDHDGDLYSVIAAVSHDASAFVLLRHPVKDELFRMATTVDFAADVLRLIITSPYQSFTVVDREGRLRYLSPVHERALGMTHGEAIGRHVTDVIENTRLHEVARTAKSEAGALHTMQGQTRLVTRMPVHGIDGEVVGAVGNIMFKGPEQLQALSAEVSRLRSQVTQYRKELSLARTARRGLEQMIGESAAMRQLKDQIAKVAPLEVPILLMGESGTGKELAAHAIHNLSRRRAEAMVMINAAAMPATLVESELFGYDPGSFTGAERKGKRGKFEQADKGTMFLDEVGDMPLEIQVKLLRVLQDGTFERVGGDKQRSSDFRLISASNRNFEEMIEAGSFRLDLFYRMSGVTLRVPALRDRVEDIQLLADHALEQFAQRHSTRRKELGPGVLEFLQLQHWPGNIRQLMHVIEAAAIFSEAPILTVKDFTMQGLPKMSQVAVPVAAGIAGAAHAAMPATPAPALQPPPVALPPSVDAAHAAPSGEPAHPVPATPPAAPEPPARQTLQALEENLIREAMHRHKGNKLRVAADLGVSRSYLYKRLSEAGLDWVRRPKLDEEPRGDDAPAATPRSGGG